jgi:hypothetical protein
VTDDLISGSEAKLALWKMAAVAQALIDALPAVACGECTKIDGCDIRLALVEHFHTVPGLDFGCVYFQRRPG